MVCLWDSLQKEGSKFQYHSIPKKKSCPFHLHRPVFSLFRGIIPWMKIPHFFLTKPIHPSVRHVTARAPALRVRHIFAGQCTTRVVSYGNGVNGQEPFKDPFGHRGFSRHVSTGFPRRIRQPGRVVGKTAAGGLLLRKRRSNSWGSESNKWQPTLWPTLKVDGSNENFWIFVVTLEVVPLLSRMPSWPPGCSYIFSRGIPIHLDLPLASWEGVTPKIYLSGTLNQKHHGLIPLPNSYTWKKLQPQFYP